MQKVFKPGAVLRELGIECTNSLGQPMSLGSCSRERKVFRTSAPSSHFDDLTVGQRPSSIETETGGAKQGRKRVDVSSTVSAHVLPRGRQDAERWAQAIIGAGVA